MKIKLILIAFIFNCLNILSQETNLKKVTYAKTEIEVPNNYNRDSRMELISNDSFSVQWIYLSKEMFDENIQAGLIKQFEKQTKIISKTAINFISNGSKLTGNKYKLKSDNALKYKIMAYGIVNDQPLILNLGFKVEPKSNMDLDELMLNFIKF